MPCGPFQGLLSFQVRGCQQQLARTIDPFTVHSPPPPPCHRLLTMTILLSVGYNTPVTHIHSLSLSLSVSIYLSLVSPTDLGFLRHAQIVGCLLYDSFLAKFMPSLCALSACL